MMRGGVGVVCWEEEGVVMVIELWMSYSGS